MSKPTFLVFFLLPLLMLFPGITHADSGENRPDTAGPPAMEPLPDISFQIRYDHSENEYHYYYLKFPSELTGFSRMRFIEKAATQGIFVPDKQSFLSDSALLKTKLEMGILTEILVSIQRETENLNVRGYEAGKDQVEKVGRIDVVRSPLPGAQVCSEASVACSANIYNFPSGTTGTAEPPVGGYPDYGCLGSQPCPAWFFMQVGVAGNITIHIVQYGIPPPFPAPQLDVDFICWGPFNSLTQGCSTGMTGANIVDCSFSPSYQEDCDIPNAQVGEIYILLITNYSQSPGNITFSQTGGTGVTNCDILVKCSMIAVTASTTACDPATNTFSVTGNIEFSNPPSTGTLTVTDITAVPPVAQALTPAFVSPMAYTLDNIPCDGLNHSLVAIFSDSTNCDTIYQFPAPEAICPLANISGGGTICDDGVTNALVNINITGSPGPYTFTYAIDGVNQPAVLDYNGMMPYQIITRVPGTYTMVSVSNAACPTAGSVTGTATVILAPVPVPTFLSGQDSVCLNVGGNVYSTEPGNFDYIWTIPPQATIVAGGNSTDNSVTLTWNTTGNYQVGVKYTSQNFHCPAAAPTFFPVVVSPLPVPTVTSGETSACLNTGYVYTTQPGKLDYSWNIPPQATVTAGGSSGDATVTLKWNTAGSYNLSVNYKEPLTFCTATTLTTYPVTVHPSPHLTNNPASKSICNGDNTNVPLTSDVTGTQFTWTVTGSSAFVSGYSDNPAPALLISQNLHNSGFDVETVTYHITPQANGCNGPVTDYVVSVFPTPDLSNTDRTDSICDSTFTNISLSSNVTGTTFTWRAFGSSPLVTGFANQATATTSIAQRLRNNSTTPQTVTYRIMPRANNCNGDSIDFVVTVFPKPKLTTSPLSKEICNNNSTGVSLVSDVAGTLFTWTYTLSSPNIVGAANSPSPDVAINQNLINTGDTPESVTYHITPAANGCSGWVYHYKVTVIPSPYLTNNPLRQTQCTGSNTNLNLISNVAGTQFDWTATASSGSLSGYSNSAAPGTLISQTLFNSGFNVDSVTYHVTPLSAGCPGSVTNYNVVVFPKPDLSNAVKNFSICDSTVISVPLTSNVAGTTFTWRAFASSPALTGYSSQGSGVTLINQRIDNTGFTTQTVTYRVSPRANGCSGDSTDIVVTVFAKPNLSNPVRAFSICDSTMATLALTSNVAGTTFTWRAFASSPLLSGFSSQASGVTLINQRIDNLGFSTETVTYRILPSANACAGDSIDVVFTVFPTADLSNTVLTQSICDSTFTNISLSSNVTGTTFTWRAFGSSPLVTGFANQATGTTSIAQQLRNNSTTVQTVTYRLMPRANNCNGDSIDFVVTVFPKPKLTTSPLSKEICNNNSTGVSLVSDVAGTLFTWTYTLSSPNIVGAANSPSPDVAINQNLINTGDTPESVTYHITPAANGCNGWVYQYSVTVIPSPYLTNNPLRQTQCNGSNTSLNLISNVAGTQFNWTATASSGSLSGYSNSAAPGTLISQTLFNSGFNVDSVTYHITPLSAGCPGSVTDFNVVVFPVPDVYFDPSGQTLCEGDASSIALRSHAMGTSYAWTATASSPNLSGYADGAGSSISQVISNAGSTVESVTYQVTPAANGCPAGATQNVLVNIRPRPVLTNTVTSFSVCNNTPTSIFLTADVPGSTFAWRAFASSPTVSGYSSSSGGSIIQTLFNSGFSVETVTFRTGATAFSCTGDSTDFSVTVFPVADAFYTPPAQAICPLQTTNILISSHVAGASFVFSPSPSSARVTGYAGGAGDLIEQTLDNSGPYIETVTYLVAPMANGCPGANSSVVASVNPFPSVSFPLCIDPVTTTDAKPIRLKGAEPSGGTYSGKGVIANTFFPATAGVGPDTLVYIHSNSYSCTKSDTLIISVIAPLPFSCGGTLTDPRDNKQYPTVWINPQCWMAANLDYGIYLPGAASQRDNCVNEKYCYGDNPANCAAFGGLYQWDEIMGYDNTAAVQGLCPPAWHIPSEAEWSTLFAQYTSNGFAGNSLKYTGYSGFNALLNGARFKNVSWNFFDFATFFWSSSSRGPDKAWAHGMNQENPSVSLYPAARYNAFQVRCVKD